MYSKRKKGKRKGKIVHIKLYKTKKKSLKLPLRLFSVEHPLLGMGPDLNSDLYTQGDSIEEN